MYAEPESGTAPSPKIAPTVALSPEIETESPKKSPAAPSEAVSLVSTQFVPINSKMYAEPEKEPLSSSPTAPTIALSPEIETESPKKSPAAPSEAVSLVSTQFVPINSKMYAEPESVPASSSLKAPTIALSPEIETEVPN